MKNYYVYVAHFESTKWTQIFAQFIRFAVFVNGKKTQINHSAIVFEETVSKKQLALESIFPSGGNCTLFKKKYSNYKGNITLCKLKNKHGDDVVLTRKKVQNIVKKYEKYKYPKPFYVMKSHEFRCILKPLNCIINICAYIEKKLSFKTTDSAFCTQLVVNIVGDIDKDVKRKMLASCNEIEACEVTPQNLYEYFIYN